MPSYKNYSNSWDPSSGSSRARASKTVSVSQTSSTKQTQPNVVATAPIRQPNNAFVKEEPKKESKTHKIWMMIRWKVLILAIILLIMLLFQIAFTFFPSFVISYFCIKPQKSASLVGLLFSPFVHDSWIYLLSDLPVFLLLSILLLLRGKSRYICVSLISVLFGNCFVFIFGESGKIYYGLGVYVFGLLSYIYLSSLLELNWPPKCNSHSIKAFIIALVATLILILFYYFDLVPFQIYGWQLPVGGCLGGILAAVILSVPIIQKVLRISTPSKSRSSSVTDTHIKQITQETTNTTTTNNNNTDTTHANSTLQSKSNTISIPIPNNKSNQVNSNVSKMNSQLDSTSSSFPQSQFTSNAVLAPSTLPEKPKPSFNPLNLIAGLFEKKSKPITFKPMDDNNQDSLITPLFTHEKRMSSSSIPTESNSELSSQRNTNFDGQDDFVNEVKNNPFIGRRSSQEKDEENEENIYNNKNPFATEEEIEDNNSKIKENIYNNKNPFATEEEIEDNNNNNKGRNPFSNETIEDNDEKEKSQERNPFANEESRINVTTTTSPAISPFTALTQKMKESLKESDQFIQSIQNVVETDINKNTIYQSTNPFDSIGENELNREISEDNNKKQKHHFKRESLNPFDITNQEEEEEENNDDDEEEIITISQENKQNILHQSTNPFDMVSTDSDTQINSNENIHTNEVSSYSKKKLSNPFDEQYIEIEEEKDNHDSLLNHSLNPFDS
ncbi:hypothetical protein WA158_008363 [Blastocystis sp. Blastoise]